MPYTKKQFLEDVTKEAVALKEHATKEELERLDFDNLNPQSYTRCIYGQMTGDCCSYRASQLIFKCCKRFVENDFGVEELTYPDIKKKVNGKVINGVTSAAKLHKNRDVVLSHLSSIEAYIMMSTSNKKNLISFLKGETNDLKL